MSSAVPKVVKKLEYSFSGFIPLMGAICLGSYGCTALMNHFFSERPYTTKPDFMAESDAIGPVSVRIA